MPSGRAKNSTGVMSADTSGMWGRGWCPEEDSRLEEGVSVKTEGTSGQLGAPPEQAHAWLRLGQCPEMGGAELKRQGQRDRAAWRAP